MTTRRNFLKTLGGLTLLTIVPRNVLGGPKHIAPSDQLTKGIIGVGGIGRSSYHFTSDKACRLVAICDVDRNHLQISGNTEDVMKLEPLADKYRAFGWNTVEIDGNDMEAVVRALTMEHEGSPLMIIAHTVKGKGISEMENIASWHHGVPDEDLYMRARAELASQRRKDG